MKKTITAVLCMTMVVCNTLKSQENMKTSEKMPFAYVDAKTIKSHNSNPFGLVYADAIKENVKGNVNILPITYDLNGLKISANIYVPATYDAAKSYPALVVAHPNSTFRYTKSSLVDLFAFDASEGMYLTIQLLLIMEPSEDFSTKIIYAKPGFIELCTPQSNYGMKGTLAIFPRKTPLS